MNQAIRGKQNWSSGNTMVIRNDIRDTSEVYLHGNLISIVHGDQVQLMDGGWQSNTTKSRLNAILSEFAPVFKVSQSEWVWYCNDEEFTSGMVVG